MAIDRLRLYLAVKEALTWRHEHDSQVQDSAPAHCEALVWAELQTALDGCEHPLPIDMVLHCPQCHRQHIDAPDSVQHWSHVCGPCGFIWRPADVPTNGVLAVRTLGRRDS